MQHLLVSVSDSANLSVLKDSLLKIKYVEHVEPIATEKYSETAIHPDWKTRLHFPAPALTDAQLEELAEDMNNETIFFSMEEAKVKGDQLIDEWHSKSLL